MGKLSDKKTRDTLLQGVRLGLNYTDAAALAGICRKTFYNWTEKAKKNEKGKYGKFFEELKKALVLGKAKHLKNIQDAGDNGTWQASAWLLERRYPEEFGLNRMSDKTTAKEKAKEIQEAVAAFDVTVGIKVKQGNQDEAT